MPALAQMLTPKEVAPLLRMHVDKIYDLCTAGELEAVNVGRGQSYPRWLIHPTAVEKFLQRRATTTPRVEPRRRPRQAYEQLV